MENENKSGVDYGYLRTVEEGDQEKLVEALMLCQAEFPNIPLNGQVGEKGKSRNFTYALLPDIMKAILPILRTNGLLLSQVPYPCPEDGNLYLMTKITHKGTKASRSCFYPVAALAGQQQQDIGKNMTYARRYSLAPMLCLVLEDDTDAEGSTARTAGGTQRPTTQQASKPAYTPVQKQTAAERTARQAVPAPHPAAPVDPETGEVAKEDDRGLASRLWVLSRSSEVTVDQLQIASKEAETIQHEERRTAVTIAIAARLAILGASNKEDLAGVRNILDGMPDGWDRKRFLELIDDKLATFLNRGV